MAPANRRRRTPRDPTALMSAEDKAAYHQRQAAQTPISEMGLPVRIVNALEEADLILCAHLLGRDRASLVAIANFGEKTLDAVVVALRRLGVPIPPAWNVAEPVPKRKHRRRTP